MSKLTGIYVGVQGDWKTVLLAAQIIALFVTALLRRYVASVILLFTTVLTVMGVLV